MHSRAERWKVESHWRSDEFWVIKLACLTFIFETSPLPFITDLDFWWLTLSMSYLLPETPIVQILFSLYTLAQCVRKKSGVVWNWYDCQRMFPWSANRPLHRQRFLYLAICRQMPSVWFWSNWELATKCYHSYSSLTSFLPSRVIWVWSLALNTIIRAHSSSHTRAEGGLSKIGGNTRELAVRLRSNTFFFLSGFLHRGQRLFRQ